MEQAKNVKLLLCVFKQLFGLKINFHNHEIFCFREANIVTRVNILNFFRCEVLPSSLINYRRWFPYRKFDLICRKIRATFVSPNKFMLKIDSTIYLMILILYHKY